MFCGRFKTTSSGKPKEKNRAISEKVVAALQDAVETEKRDAPVRRLCRKNLRQAIQAVEGSRFVAFRQRGIVENRVDEISDFAFQREDRLAYVQKFGGVFAKNVHAEKLETFTVEKQFQAAVGVAADLPARNFAVVGNA